MGAGRHNLGGVQEVEAQSVLQAELLSRSRGFSFVTDFILLEQAMGFESMLAITNGNNYPLMIDWCGIASSAAGVIVHFQLYLNPLIQTATVPYVPEPLDRVNPQVFDGSALVFAGVDTGGPVGGDLIWQESVHEGQAVQGAPPVILAKNDVLMVVAIAINGTSTVCSQVLAHNIYSK